MVVGCGALDPELCHSFVFAFVLSVCLCVCVSVCVCVCVSGVCVCVCVCVVCVCVKRLGCSDSVGGVPLLTLRSFKYKTHERPEHTLTQVRASP